MQVTAIGRDEADAQFLSRLWRYLAYRETTPTFFPTRRQQVEYEAYVELLARDRGVAAPGIVAAGSAGGLAVLVEEIPVGTPLADLPKAKVTDALLDRVWTRGARAPRHAASRTAHSTRGTS